ncbi:ribonuclease [Paraburkholderia susongensis]|uniref:Ribonuclease T1 n=1 Tax=Paraburkholderia susongensis TaxID=1515439 RepID=A0A1X7LUA7_9BURK|nr:ribonuclease [Paraburkholderia susongensis]SMG57250.1 ribonuclease T1 [Paraburkholderia susongensis]
MARNGLRIKGVLIGVVALCALSGSVPDALARKYTDSAATNVEVGTIALAQLPREAVNTLNLIAAGGPYPYEKDGIVFGNFERVLPAHRRGYYHEYTVPTPHARNRGARRIVCGGPLQRTDNCYYSDDHYTSFNRIVE